MKIAQVTLRFDAPGGVETNVQEVSRRLRAAGEDVTVYASDLYDESRWERRTGFRSEVDGVPVRRFPVRKRLIPGLTMPLMVGLVDALAAASPDVVHAHSHRYGHVLESAAVAERRGIPLVVSTHYHPADRREPAWKRGMLRIQDVGFGATAYRVARALVVETQREAALVREFAPAERVHVIPPGIDLSEWSGTSAPVPGLPSPYVLFIGRLAPNKGLRYLVEAMRHLPGTPSAHLVLMGRDWGERPQLEAQVRADGLTERVHFLDYVASPEEYRSVVRGAAALALPSEWEAFGLVLLEGMAAGVPVVASRVGGVPEVLEEGNSGRLVRYGDPVGLAEALAEALAHGPPARARVARAREWVRQFDWSLAVERHRALYRAVAGG